MYRVSLTLEWPSWKRVSAGGKALSAGSFSRKGDPVFRGGPGAACIAGHGGSAPGRSTPTAEGTLELQAHRVQSSSPGGPVRGHVFRIPDPRFRKLAWREILARTPEFWK